MNATMCGHSAEDGDRVRWSEALWTVTERDGRFVRLERVGTTPVFGAGAVWVDVSLLDACGQQERS